jgi:hypothetical protein
LAADPAQTLGLPAPVFMAVKATIRSILAEGDRQTIGRVNEVVAQVRLQPKKIAHVVDCCGTPTLVPLCARPMQPRRREQAALLQPYKAALVGLLSRSDTSGRALAPRGHDTAPEPDLRGMPACRLASLVSSGGPQLYRQNVRHAGTLGSDTHQDTSVRPMVLDLIRSLTRTGTPAMRARGRILLRKMERRS